MPSYDGSRLKCHFLKKNSTRDPPQNKGHTETESEGLEKDTPHKETKRKKE